MTKHTSTLYINSGTCVCGHSWEDHHLCMIVNKHAYDAIIAWLKKNHPGRTWTVEGVDGPQEMGYPMYMPGECEKFGFNECGGMQYDEATDTWSDHCHNYRDKDGDLGEVEWETPQ